MQLCRIVYYSVAGLHVSRNIFAHHQEHLNCITASGIIHVCRCRLVSWECWNWLLIQLSSWGWAQSCSKHVEDSNKHIIEEIVRQGGHLPELYQDARSEKYKILYYMSRFCDVCGICQFFNL